VIAPVEEFNEIPAGRVPELILYVGLLVAETESEYGVPTINVLTITLSVHTGGVGVGGGGGGGGGVGSTNWNTTMLISVPAA
jgi:hypothetical protein